MINTTLFWLLLVPVIIGILHFYTLRKDWREALIVTGVSTAVGAFITVLAIFVSMGHQTRDVEIWNGYVVGKSRVQGHYVRSYDCNCVQTCSGSGNSESCSNVCQTCYEDHYTVKWWASTSIKDFLLDSVDSTSRHRAYSTPDPHRFTITEPNEPVAVANGYTNYIQAVPNSLFAPSSKKLREKFATLIPTYPDSPFDFYRINRFFHPGLQIPDAKEWNDSLGRMLNHLGSMKQVNVVVVAAKTDDPNYEYALRDAWENGNKNDVIVVLGTPSWPKIEWVRIITWAKSETFKVELHDELLALEVADKDKFFEVLHNQIVKNFKRREMAEFAYLQNEIDPPAWVLVTLVLLQILAAVIVQLVIHGAFERGIFRKKRRW